MLNVHRFSGKSSRKKGLSDLISIMLLVAFTVGTVFLIGTWVNGMVKDSSAENKDLADKRIDCSFANFEIDESSLDYTNGTNGTVSFLVLNKGSVNLYNFTIFALGDEINELILENPLVKNDSLVPGEIRMLSGYGKINGTMFRVFPRVCPESVLEIDV